MDEKKISRKLQHERRIVADMIALYCRKKHSTKELCNDCRTLAEYADRRTMACPKMAEKTFCSQCKSHCYRQDMRERIREVMRFAGPRIILHHPIAALRHLYYSKLKKSN
ncbi:MAG: nitrous oxide-stimulated promoter family protein [Alistipes sp.]|nr:nitrous oxide-stimulated promoter family protein [Alistipes sp.]